MNPNYPNEPTAIIPPKSEVERLRELLVKERQTSGDALLALNAKQDELVAVQGENNRLRVVAADKAQAERHLVQWKASYNILQGEADTLTANNRAYKRANWLLLIVCAGLVFSLLKGN